MLQVEGYDLRAHPKGELKQYVHNPKVGASNKNRWTEKGKAKLGEGINMIFRGLASSNKERKALTRRVRNPPLYSTMVMQCHDTPSEEHYPMVFTEDDAKVMHHPHNNSLVVISLIGNK